MNKEKLRFSNWPAAMRWSVIGLVLAVVFALGGFFGYYALMVAIAVASVFSSFWLPMAFGVIGVGIWRGYAARKSGGTAGDVTRAFGMGMLWTLIAVAVVAVASGVYLIAVGF
ncbi:MAG: hypothetical protein K2Y32_24095 [Candidatus Obscuribacterales bacterium]|nr:hypothetical protein [Candidatus Obscuribacterales bacterium]